MKEECGNIIQEGIDLNETEINWDTLDKIIEERPYITSSAIMDIFGNEDNMNERRGNRYR